MGNATSIDHLPIGKLLEQQKLCVPDYQRAYAWNKSEVVELLDDVLGALQRQDSDYFLGSVVLATPDGGGSPTIVDGQQRLATTTMIYAAIRDYLAEHDEEARSERIADRYLYSTDDWGSDAEPKLSLSVSDRTFFTSYVLEKPGTDRRQTDKPSTTDPDSHHRIADAFEIIRNRVDAVAKGAPSDPLAILRDIDKYLATNVRVIVVMAADEANAFQIFETLNDRGLDLSIADLLKNYVYGKASSKIEEAKSEWTQAMGIVGSEGGDANVLQFIHHYWASRVGLVRSRDLYKSIKKSIASPHDAVAFATQLLRNSRLYAAMLNSDHDYWSGVGSEGQDDVATLRFLKVEQNMPLMLACLDTFDQKNPEELRKVLRLLVGWTVRFKVTGQFGSAKLEQFYGRAGAQVRTDKLRTAKAVSDAFSSEVPSDAEFHDSFSRLQEKVARQSRYYLREIENHLRQGGELEVLRNPRKVNLEHVYPKNATAADWPSFGPEIGPLYLNRLGNHALMIRAENDKIGNKPFAVKRPIFAKSSLETTSQIATAATWSKDDIDTRQATLATVAVEVWKRNA